MALYSLTHSLRQKIKMIVEHRFPSLSVFYRMARDEYRWLCQKPKTVLPFGFQLMGNSSMQDGTFEPEETDLFRSLLANTDVFIDVGANIGYYTCLALSMGKQVVAVEPLHQNVRLLYRNLQINGWDAAEVYPIGIAARPGLAQLYGRDTGASIMKGWNGIPSALRQTISLNTLDNIIGNRFSSKAITIKVDVEGAELDLLRGANNILNRSPKPLWVMEVSLSEHRKMINPFFHSVFELFWANGYDAQTADSKHRVVLDSDVQRWVKQGYCDFGCHNWLFSPKKQDS